MSVCCSEGGVSSPSQPPVDGETKAKDSNEPYPLPMPAFGGYYAPLNVFVPSDGPFLINSIQR